MDLQHKLLVAYLMIFIVTFCVAPFVNQMKLYLGISVPILVLLAIALGVYTYQNNKNDNSNNNKKHS